MYVVENSLVGVKLAMETSSTVDVWLFSVDSELFVP